MRDKKMYSKRILRTNLSQKSKGKPIFSLIEQTIQLEEGENKHHIKISRTITAKTSVPLEKHGLQNQMQNDLDV